MGLVRSLLSLKKLDVQGVEIGTEWNGNKTAGPTSPCRNFRWEDMEISEKKTIYASRVRFFSLHPDMVFHSQMRCWPTLFLEKGRIDSYYSKTVYE